MKSVLVSRKAGERGQASLFLLAGLTVSLLALALLYVRLGEANDMRSTAQSAADAAALAAVGDIEDRAAETIANDRMPFGVSWKKTSGKQEATEYAKENDATLTDIRASDNEWGMSGNIVRVEVKSDHCQRELKDDGSVKWNDRDCPTKKELKKAKERGESIPTQKGNADAIAKVELPECKRNTYEVMGTVIDEWISCRPNDSSSSYQRIWTAGQAKGMIDTKLVDQEGKWIFSELSGGPGTGRISCEPVGKQNITRTMCETHKQIMGEWQSLFRKYGVGCYRQDDHGQHPLGRACDYMVADGVPASSKYAKGADAAAQWMIDHHKELNIKYIIWEQRIWNPSKGNPDPVGQWEQVSRKMDNRGSATSNHYDHIHVSVLGSRPVA